MPGITFTRPSILTLLLMTAGLNVQTTSLALSSPTMTPDGTATLELSLNSSSANPPTALQWTLPYPLTSIVGITVDDGPASTAAGKKTITDGVVTQVTVMPAPGTTTATIRLGNALWVAPSGDPIPISAAGGTITTAKAANSPPVRSAAEGR